MTDPLPHLRDRAMIHALEPACLTCNLAFVLALGVPPS